jgi:hypothetical protein
MAREYARAHNIAFQSVEIVCRMSLKPARFEDAKIRYKPMHRSPIVNKGSGLKPGNKRLGPGKKVNAWANARKSLKVQFEAMGITSCELQYDGCANDDYLGFAHAAKRRKLTSEDLDHVILACNFCHDKIEFLAPEEMKAIVDETIEGRG